MPGDHANCPIGASLASLVAELGTISAANAALREYHLGRRKDLATA